jgi:PAS domain S-box-containing protein
MFESGMRTIAFTLVLICLVSAVVTVQLWIQYRSRYKGIAFWIADFALQVIATALVLSQGEITNKLYITIAQSLFLTGVVFGYHGLLAFAGMKKSKNYNYILLIIFALLQVFFIFLKSVPHARYVSFLVFSLLFFGQCTIFLFAGVPKKIRSLTLGTGLVFTGFTIMTLIRIVAFITSPPSVATYFYPEPYEFIELNFMLMLLLFLIYSLILMYSRRLLQDIRMEEQKFSIVFHTAPYCIALSRLSDGYLLEVNDGFESIFGYSREYAKGKTTTELGIWESEADRFYFVENLNRSSLLHDMEYNFRRKDRSSFICSMSAKIIVINSEECILSSIIDITEKKVAGEKLKRSEKNLADAERISHSGSWVHNITNQRSELSENTYNIFDVERSQLNNKQFSDIIRKIIHPDDRARFTKFYHDKLKGTGEKDFVFRIIRKDGRIRFIQLIAETLKDDNGKNISIFGKVQDITEKKLEDDDLRASEEKFRDLFENSPLGNTVTNMDGTISVNNSFCLMTGYTMEELSGINWSNITHPDDIQITEDTVNHMLSGNHDKLRVEKRYIRKDGSILYAEVSACLSRNSKGEPLYFITTINDISDRVAMENEMRKMNEELEHRVADRTKRLEESHHLLIAANKDLEAFTYSVSHDLRAPLRAIEGYTKILEEDYSGKLDQNAIKIILSILRNTGKMGTLIDDLLALSHVGRSQMKISMTIMKKIVESVYSEITENKENLKIEFTIADLDDILCDPGLIRQVWVNLISNAVKFSSRAEIIRISVASTHKENTILYSITDNGTGFDMEYYPKLFGVFERLHGTDEYDGTGVGLAIVKRIITKHGGEVWAHSKPGQGATFSFSLPVTPVGH